MKSNVFRTVLSSLNLLTTIVLLGAMFIMVNWIASRRYTRWDFTHDKVTALSDRTVQVLKTLEEPLTVTVFYQPDHRLYGLVDDLLREYQRLSPKVKVEHVDPEQDRARATLLAQQLQIEALNVVVFQSGTRHKYLSDTELADFDYSAATAGGQPRVTAFKGEDAFTSAIVNVTQKEQPLIWVTSGHGEKAADQQDPSGLSEVKRYLEQQSISVEAVTLLERSEIPNTVKLIFIAGPKRRFTESEVSLLQAYLDKGGRILALLDPLTDTGLESFLERWGVKLGQDIVVDPARQLPFVSAANLFVTTYSQHPIVKKMQTLMTLYPLARSVQPIKPPPSGLTVTTLAFTSEAGWGETKTSVETFERNDEDLKGPVPIAVAVERSGQPPARMAVIGDSDFIANAQLGNVGNRDLLLGATYWLIQQEQLIGIGPKPIEGVKLNLTASELSRLFWFSLLGMPILCGLAGTTTWWVRRK